MFFFILKVLFTTACLSSSFWIYITWNNGYWEKKGIFFLKPIAFYGSIKERMLMKISAHELDRYLYEKMEGLRFGGYFEGRNPVLLIKDPELLKQLLIKHSNHFINRRRVDVHDKHMNNMLTLLENEKWKNVRSVMTPTFTSGRLKGISTLIDKCSLQLVENLKEVAKTGDAIELRSYFGRFTIDIIASSAFGVEGDSIKHPDNEFYQMAMRLQNPGKLRLIIVTLLFFTFPKLIKLMQISILPKDVMDYFVSIVKGAIVYRDKNNIRTNDFLQLMMDAREGNLTKDSSDSPHGLINVNAKTVLTEDIMVAQSLLFIMAGFDQMAALLSFVIYELVINPEIQDRLREEILNTIDDKRGTNIYDLLHEMKYLEMVIQETLRKNPPASRIERRCNTRCQVPGTDFYIEEGDLIVASVVGTHYDDKYFPDPERFDPERFSEERSYERSQYTFMPFGLGPRNCIGNRFALLEAKIALVRILSNFRIILDPRTDVPYKHGKRRARLSAVSGIWVKFEERN